MLVRQLAQPALERKSGTCGAQSVVRLIASAVEARNDAVADELFHLAAELTRDQRRSAPQYELSTAATSLGVERAEKLVNPTRSPKRTLMFWWRSRVVDR